MSQLLTVGADTGAITMSSREIAELTGKQHKHVLDDIRKMLEDLGQTSAGFSADLPDAYGRLQPAYSLPKRECLILVAGYSVVLRARIIDRWQELEAQVAKPAFQLPSTFSAALRLAAEQAEQIEQQQAQLAIVAPKVEALDRISKADGELCISDAAKAMQIQPRKLFAWMEQNHWIFRRGNKWVAYQDRIQSGYLTHRVTLVERKDGTDKEVAQVLVTAKGQAKLSEVVA